eukprot:TRINITY_DN28958_c0_g2_i1.p1 TRINITY_DN28958_c0_g2~~TRINITY_DN28958_c0_g2_i1.p1  ORF type:complete len:343 (-),score=101.61 TRINITY_DN28958_c0_g2_i1:75-1103(-)
MAAAAALLTALLRLPKRAVAAASVAAVLAFILGAPVFAAAAVAYGAGAGGLLRSELLDEPAAGGESGGGDDDSGESDYAMSVLDDEPLAYWRLNEEQGSSVVNHATSELSKRGLGSVADGTLVGAVVLKTASLLDGDPDKSMDFMGSDEEGEMQVRMKSCELNEYEEPLEKRTVELWFKANSVREGEAQILFEEGTSTAGISIFMESHSDDIGKAVLGMSSWSNATWGSLVVRSSPNTHPIRLGVRHHAVFVHSGNAATPADGEIIGYLDGSLFAEADGAGSIPAHEEGVVLAGMQGSTRVGGEEVVAGGSFNGTIDEVAVYNKALPANRIQVHFDTGMGNG